MMTQAEMRAEIQAWYAKGIPWPADRLQNAAGGHQSVTPISSKTKDGCHDPYATVLFPLPDGIVSHPLGNVAAGLSSGFYHKESLGAKGVWLVGVQLPQCHEEGQRNSIMDYHTALNDICECAEIHVYGARKQGRSVMSFQVATQADAQALIAWSGFAAAVGDELWIAAGEHTEEVRAFIGKHAAQNVRGTGPQRAIAFEFATAAH